MLDYVESYQKLLTMLTIRQAPVGNYRELLANSQFKRGNGRWKPYVVRPKGLAQVELEVTFSESGRLSTTWIRPGGVPEPRQSVGLERKDLWDSMTCISARMALVAGKAMSIHRSACLHMARI